MKLSEFKAETIKKYEYVVENQIDYIKADVLKEVKSEIKRKSSIDVNDGDFYLSELEKARRLLPIYNLRE